MDEKVQYWIDTAQYDLDTARAMLETKRYLYVGFMCHQTIEKALKAVIANSNKFPPKIHNLIELAKQSSIYGIMDESYRKLIRELNPLNIESRYPSYKDNINAILTEKYCTQLLENVGRFYEWIKVQL